MTEGKPAIRENMVVTLDYTLTLDNGEVADSTQDGMPLRFLAGSGELLPAFEDALTGMTAGDELNLTLSLRMGMASTMKRRSRKSVSRTSPRAKGSNRAWLSGYTTPTVRPTRPTSPRFTRTP